MSSVVQDHVSILLPLHCCDKMLTRSNSRKKRAIWLILTGYHPFLKKIGAIALSRNFFVLIDPAVSFKMITQRLILIIGVWPMAQVYY